MAVGHPGPAPTRSFPLSRESIGRSQDNRPRNPGAPLSNTRRMGSRLRGNDNPIHLSFPRKRESIGRRQDNRPPNVQARRVGMCRMDSRFSLPSNALVGGGNDISVCERESNFVSRCVRSRIDPQQSSH